MATIEVTSANLNDTIGNGIAVLDFWAAWCGPCRQFGPTFEAASEKYPDITFGKVDVDAQTEIAQTYGVMSIPTLFIYRDGVQLYRGAGALPAAQLEDLIEQAKNLDMEEVKKVAQPQNSGYED